MPFLMIERLQSASPSRDKHLGITKGEEEEEVDT